jgi:hypothetical protein
VTSDETQATGDASAGEPRANNSYKFSPDHVRIAAASVDAGFRSAERWHAAREIQKDLASRGVRDSDLLAVETVRVGYHHIRLNDATKAPVTELVTLDHLASMVTPEVLRLWAELEPLLATSAARARINDLLWMYAPQNRFVHAQTAIDAYLEQAAQCDSDLHQTEVIIRAWDLARQLGDRSRVAASEEAAIEALHSGLESSEYNPGVTLPLLEILTGRPSRGEERTATRTAQIRDLLERALSAYQTHEVGYVSRLMERIAADENDIDRIRRRHSEMSLQQAEATPDGLLKQIRLQDAIAVANNHGYADLASRATIALQNIDPANLGLQRIETVQTIPIHERESLLDKYTRGRSWRDGLDRFLFSLPPTGTKSELDAATHEYLSAGHLHNLFPHVSLTSEGLPRYSSPGDDHARALGWQTGFRAQVFGEILATGLARIADNYGIPEPSDVRHHIIERGADDLDLADALARAICHYWNGDFDSALHVAIPRVEAAARSLLRECDIAIYRTQAGKSKGAYIGLYGLLNGLEQAGIDPDWTHFLRYTLLGPHGMNLRDDAAHGLLGHASPIEAALTLRAAALLILIAAPGRDETTTDSALDPATGRWPGATRGVAMTGARLLHRLSTHLDRAAFRIANYAVRPRG